MGYLKSALVTVAAIVFFVAVAKVSGWSPLNLIFGPQYRAQSQPTTDSRTTFLTKVVPQKYPKLLDHLRHTGSETVRWAAESGEKQEQILSLTDNGLLIETSIFTGSSSAQAGTSSEKVLVRMSDANLDGLMDKITYVEASGRDHSYEAPFDDTSQFLWDTAMAVTFRYGKCCQ